MASSRLGGIETANLELARVLSRMGHDISIATKDEVFEEPGITHVPWSNLGVVGDQYSVVISSNDAQAFNSARSNAMCVWWVHNPYTIEKLVRKGVAGPLLRRRPHAVFPGIVAETLFNRLVPFQSRSVIFCGVPELFRITARLSERRPIFVWASQPQRGLPETLRAWREQAPAAEMHVFGCTLEQGQMSPEDAKLYNVLFIPRAGKAELAREYAAATAMIYPGARDETFCLAAAEAQSMGLPVVTMGIGSLSERVQNGINGLICSSHEGMVRAALHLMKDRELWSLLSEGAIATSHLFTWDRAARQWERLIEGL